MYEFFDVVGLMSVYFIGIAGSTTSVETRGCRDESRANMPEIGDKLA